MTIQKLIETWRSTARECQEDARRAGGSVLLGTQSLVTHRCADELASTLAGMTCATCKHFAGKMLATNGSVGTVWQSCNLFMSDKVPQRINGQPFSCAAHSPQSDS